MRMMTQTIMTARELLLVLAALGNCLHSCLQNTACIGCFQVLLASSMLCCCANSRQFRRLPMLVAKILELLADQHLKL